MYGMAAILCTKSNEAEHVYDCQVQYTARFCSGQHQTGYRLYHIVYSHASDYVDTMSNSHVKEKSSLIHFRFQFLI